jgi:hypothetical protein
MPATYRTSFAGGGTSGSGDRTLAFTPAVGDHLTAFVCTSGNTNNTPTASDNQSGTWSLVGCLAWNASADRIAVFVRDASVASAVSHTLTIATGANTAGALVVVAYSGMLRFGTSSIRSSGGQANQAASSTPAPALNQAALTGNPTIAMVGSGDTTTSPNASWTERQDTSQSTPTTAIEVCTRDSGFTGTTITFGATQATVYASYAIELDSSAPPITGTAAITEAGETTAGVAAVVVAATASIADAGEATSGTAALLVEAVGTIADVGETAAGSAGVLVDAAAAITDAGETTAGTAEVASGNIEGTAAITDGGETAAGVASVLVEASGSASDGAEIVGGAAAVLIAASAAIADGGELAAGTAGVLVSATGAVTESSEAVSGAGDVESDDIEATAAIVEEGELVVGEAYVTPLPFQPGDYVTLRHADTGSVPAPLGAPWPWFVPRN